MTPDAGKTGRAAAAGRVPGGHLHGEGFPDATRVVLGDELVVANAGLVLPAVFAAQLDSAALIDRRADLG